MKPNLPPIMFDRLFEGGDIAMQVEKIARSLCDGPLQPSQIGTLKGLMSKIDQSGCVLCKLTNMDQHTNPGSVTNQREFYYQAIIFKKEGQLMHTADFVLTFTPKTVSYFIRTHPIYWNIAHLQSRRMQRAKEVLDYGNGQFHGTIGLGLLTAEIVGETLRQSGQRSESTLLFEPEGMYFGECRLADAPVDKNKHYIACYDPDQQKGIFMGMASDHRPQAEIIVRTFLHASQFKTLHRRLHADFLGLNNHVPLTAVAMTAYNNYITLRPYDSRTFPTRESMEACLARPEKDIGWTTSTPPIRPDKFTDPNPGQEGTAMMIASRWLGETFYPDFMERMTQMVQGQAWREYVNARQKITQDRKYET